MDLLCDVNAFSVGQSTVNRSSSGRSQRWVKRINVKAQVNRSLLSKVETRMLHLVDCEQILLLVKVVMAGGKGDLKLRLRRELLVILT